MADHERPSSPPTPADPATARKVAHRAGARKGGRRRPHRLPTPPAGQASRPEATPGRWGEQQIGLWEQRLGAYIADHLQPKGPQGRITYSGIARQAERDGYPINPTSIMRLAKFREWQPGKPPPRTTVNLFTLWYLVREVFGTTLADLEAALDAGQTTAQQDADAVKADYLALGARSRAEVRSLLLLFRQRDQIAQATTEATALARGGGTAADGAEHPDAALSRVIGDNAHRDFLADQLNDQRARRERDEIGRFRSETGTER